MLNSRKYPSKKPSDGSFSLPRMKELDEYTLFPEGTKTWNPSLPLPIIPELKTTTTNKAIDTEPQKEFRPSLKAQQLISKPSATKKSQPRKLVVLQYSEKSTSSSHYWTNITPKAYGQKDYTLTYQDKSCSKKRPR